MDGAVVEPTIELGLGLCLRGEIDEFPGQLAIRRAFEHAPRAGAAHGAVPDQLDRDTALLELGGARIPDRHYVDFAVADELLRLVALAPPHLDMRLDTVELLECAVDVEGIELVARHSVR